MFPFLRSDFDDSTFCGHLSTLQDQTHEEHGHTHEHMDHPGAFADREQPLLQRDLNERGFTVGIGGPVGSGYVQCASELL